MANNGLMDRGYKGTHGYIGTGAIYVKLYTACNAVPPVPAGQVTKARTGTTDR